MLSLTAGQIVADKYRIDAVVGSGGMGVVVAATHVELGQRVAIKLLRDVSHEGLARFNREARLLVRLKSQHVARVFDVGSLDDETPYIVMELLEGSDLGKLLEAKGRFPVEEAVDHLLQAMCAVAEAHTLGMVHRDLKPANMFLAAGPGGSTVVKVLDFGISKVLDDRREPGDLTNEGVALGSPGYMSPEQIDSSRDVDVRADIYSLGAILYRFVTGRNPYKGNSVVSIMASMAVDPLPPLRSLAPEAPEAFASVVEKALEKERDARFPDVKTMAQALGPFASRRGRASLDEILATFGTPRASIPGSSTDPSLAGVARVIPEPPMAATIVRPLSTRPRPQPMSTAPIIGGGLVLLVGAGALAYAITSREPTPPPRRTAIPVIVTSAPPPADPPPAIATTSEPTPEPKPSAHPTSTTKIRPTPPRHPASTSTGPAEVPPDRH